MQMSQHLSISLVFPDKAEAAFNAIKESTLPQEVIEDLTAEVTFNKVLTRAGLGVHQKRVQHYKVLYLKKY